MVVLYFNGMQLIICKYRHRIYLHELYIYIGDGFSCSCNIYEEMASPVRVIYMHEEMASSSCSCNIHEEMASPVRVIYLYIYICIYVYIYL